MRPTLSQSFNPQRNSFNLLRLFFATGVVISHCPTLGWHNRTAALWGVPQGLNDILGVVCVNLFFLLSGFLITRSFLRLKSLGRFLWHRALRILPGYWVCLVVTAYILAPLMLLIEGVNPLILFHIREHGLFAYVTGNWWLYKTEYVIAGATAFSPGSKAINGSIWTLYPEVLAYIAVAIIGALGLLRRARYLVLAGFIGLVVLHTCSQLNHAAYLAITNIQSFILVLFVYFAAGVVACLFSDLIPFGKKTLALAVGCVLISYSTRAEPLIWPIALSYVTLWIGIQFPAKFIEKYGDLSFGVYIYSFPIQQVLALAHVPDYGDWTYFSLSMLVTLAFAHFSYTLVEAPALRLKSITPFWKAKRIPPIAPVFGKNPTESPEGFSSPEIGSHPIAGNASPAILSRENRD